jgi:hypothetical protein
MNRVTRVTNTCLALNFPWSVIHSKGKSEPNGIKIGYILYNEVKMHQIMAEHTFRNKRVQGKKKEERIIKCRRLCAVRQWYSNARDKYADTDTVQHEASGMQIAVITEKSR